MKLQRSLLFWLGLPGFVFILWSWFDSLGHEAGITRYRTITHATVHTTVRRTLDNFIGHARSTFTIRWPELGPEHAPVTVFLAPKFTRKPLSPVPSEGWRDFFPRRQNSTADANLIIGHGVTKDIFIPHWQILLTYCIAWFGLMAWRWLRVKRLKATALELRLTSNE